MGGESLGTGVQFRYLLPTPFFLSLTVGAFNEIGHVHGAGGHGHDEHGHDEHAEDEHAEDEHAEDEHAEDEHGEDEHGEDEHGEDEHGEDEHGEEEHGEDEHGEDEHGEDEHGEDEHGEDEHGEDEHGEEDHGEDEHGEDEHGEEEHGEDEHAEEGARRFLNQLTYLGRVHAFFELSETWNLEMGSSVALTPRSETGEEGSRRSRLGLDVTLRHRPLVAGLYEGFTVAGEWLANRQSHHDAPTTDARGGYAYAQLDFNPEIQGRWGVGLLFDSAPDLEHPSDKTLSLSPYVTWSLSEFNRLRLQYTYGWDSVGSEVHDGSRFYLQWTTALGSHTHGFRQRR